MNVLSSMTSISDMADEFSNTFSIMLLKYYFHVVQKLIFQNGFSACLILMMTKKYRIRINDKPMYQEYIKLSAFLKRNALIEILPYKHFNTH